MLFQMLAAIERRRNGNDAEMGTTQKWERRRHGTTQTWNDTAKTPVSASEELNWSATEPERGQAPSRASLLDQPN
jgi:hypothetical protein